MTMKGSIYRIAGRVCSKQPVHCGWMASHPLYEHDRGVCFTSILFAQQLIIMCHRIASAVVVAD